MSYDDVRIGAFLDDVASERVAPAGGTVVAVAGAMGAALCEMACIHTTNAGEASDATVRQGDGAAERSFEVIRDDLARQRRELLALAAQDATLVDELFGGDGEPTDRLAKRASGIPLATAESSLAVLEDAAAVVERGRSGVAADARAGAYLADAAVQASLSTVRVNAAALSDHSFAETMTDRADAVSSSAAEVRSEILSDDCSGR
ncbi:cyclodeaminase/cyclohydrolase family protein [Halobellus limi]|uniref:Formimidoyltetrahydrofolate cyclodeaminase n=1 Tax=Halobellus limi TaxID=699433 RepID=A0A1H6AFF8_9EURY|nr:cyclodeaminase/cyclohydrolase family protein [Halobellus limi]QCC47560.1 formimidoyltetrahydrofolate cyclodeaminase [Halobellus limi]SEG47231.1 formiminotetrahydrofolate cyclodeaminase [Halobellus limi]